MIAAVVLLLLFLAGGMWFASILDRVAVAMISGGSPFISPLAPLRAAAGLLLRQSVSTERPDALIWALAPVLYLTLAALGMSVVPLGSGRAVANLEVGIVFWGACEALTVVVVFLHGWSANAPFPLIGAYRYAAIGLPMMLVSMFVLIAAALPAESLGVREIVASQRDFWNVLRQPLGLPLFLLLGLSLSLRGPFDYADPYDLAGGTTAEVSGPALASWQAARLAMLVSAAGMTSAVFLGGPLGPVLPGPVWVSLKMALVIAVLVAASHLLARMPPARMLTLIWTILMPLAFLDLVIAGVEVLA